MLHEQHVGHVHLPSGRVLGPFDLHLSLTAPRGSPASWRVQLTVPSEVGEEIKNAPGNVRVVTTGGEGGEAYVSHAAFEGAKCHLGLQGTGTFGPLVTVAKFPTR